MERLLMDFLLCIIGMVMVIEGIPYFAFPEKTKAVFRIAIAQPDKALRIFGAILMVTGLTIVFLVKRIPTF